MNSASSMVCPMDRLKIPHHEIPYIRQTPAGTEEKSILFLKLTFKITFCSSVMAKAYGPAAEPGLIFTVVFRLPRHISTSVAPDLVLTSKPVRHWAVVFSGAIPKNSTSVTRDINGALIDFNFW